MTGDAQRSRVIPILILVAIAAAGGLLGAGTARAQASPVEAEASQPVGWHTVRPGDTLRGLSRSYSGDERLWRQNWQLNPELDNPDLLQPGQRLRLLLTTTVPSDVARITRLARSVESKPNPYPWNDARIGELLRDEDALRTFMRSSAEMRFHDGSALKVTESSLVFMRRFGDRLRGPSRGEIEIVEGQADLGGHALTGIDAGVDVLVGPALARPKPGAGGDLNTRARRARGGAQMMVYAGESSVESGGAKVAVAAGMGTSVPAAGPPSPPEALLPAPVLTSPAAEARLGYADPTFEWEPVAGAASYVLELCLDPDCARLERRLLDLTDQRWGGETLEMGERYWRVTAVAASGLDGFPSPTRAVAILAATVDHTPPTARLVATGPQVRCGERLVLGPTARLQVEAADEGSAVAGARFELDGRAVSAAEWGGALPAGSHTTQATVSDLAGNQYTTPALDVVIDDVPPKLLWEVGDQSLLTRFGDPEPRRRAKPQRGEVAPLEWSVDGRRWLPLRPTSGREPGGFALGDRPQILLRAVGTDPFAPGAPIHLGDRGLLRITAEDAECSVDRLRFGIGPTLAAGARGLALWIEAVDPLGNVATLEWPVVPAQRSR